MRIVIRSYRIEWAVPLARLYHRAVHAIEPSLYSSAAKEVWAPSPPVFDWWEERLSRTQPYVALLDGKVAGFIEFGGDGHIDCLYTDPDYQRRGVAGALYAHVLAAAQANGIRSMTVDASLVIRPFFERRGFTVVRENCLQRQGVRLRNFTMRKVLQQE